MRRPRTAIVALAAVVLVALGVGTGYIVGATTHPSNAAAESPGVVDVGFTQDMVTHHQHAVTMAQFVAGNNSTDIESVARMIEANQTLEIGQMQGMQALWSVPTLPDGPPMSWMQQGTERTGHPDTAMSGMAAMPGMASQDEMESVRTATGTKQGILFLQLMLRHHQGGENMMLAAAQRASTAAVRDLARRMLVEQNDEGQLLQMLLGARGASPLPAPTP